MQASRGFFSYSASGVQYWKSPFDACNIVCPDPTSTPPPPRTRTPRERWLVSFYRSLQVVKACDVLFLFGGAAAVRDTIKSIKDELKGNQIVVPVIKDGDLDNFQVHKVCMRQPVSWECFHHFSVANHKDISLTDNTCNDQRRDFICTASISDMG